MSHEGGSDVLLPATAEDTLSGDMVVSGEPTLRAVDPSPSVESSRWLRREMVDISQFKVDMIYGQGTYGDVFKATEINTGTSVALKRLKMEKETQGFPITAIREIKILKALRHENVVTLKEMIYCHENSNFYGEENSAATKGIVYGDIFMVLEFCEYDLAKLLKSSSVKLSKLHIKSFMKQLLHGVHYMHKNMILHRDIKGANILVTKDNVLKIGDWGLARSYMSHSAAKDQLLTNHNQVVTLWYRSPELLLGSRKYASEIDIWSVGCLFGEMLTRTAMLQGRDEANQLELIYQLLGTPSGALAEKFEQETFAMKGKGEREKMYPNWDKFKFQDTYPGRLRKTYASLDNNSLALLENLMDMNPSTRASASAALDFEYFWSEDIPPPQQLPRLSVDGMTVTNEMDSMKRKHQEAVDKYQRDKETAIRNTGGSTNSGTGSTALASKPAWFMKRQNIESKYKIIKKPGGSGSGVTADASGGKI